MATASDIDILARLRAANVPVQAYEHSLHTLKQHRFSEIVAGQKFDMKEGGLVSYLVRHKGPLKDGGAGIVRVCAVAAKELVLLRRAVAYNFIASIAAAIHDPELLTDQMSALRKGYLVIGDVGKNVGELKNSDWQLIQALLLSHMNRGGGLIIGDTGVTNNGMWNADFLDALSIFDVIMLGE
jgi:hypothetical protein